MQRTEDKQGVRNNHRGVKSSTTLSRKYTKRPKMGNEINVSIKKSAEIQHFSSEQSMPAMDMMRSQAQPQAIDMLPAQADNMTPASAHPMQRMANTKMQARTRQMKKMSGIEQRTAKVSAKELKDRAIRKALAAANNADSEREKQSKFQMHFGFARIMLALACATAAVAAIVYFVNLNMPDISLRVAAAQTGINASFPEYIPRNYRISGVTSEQGRITIDFENSSENKSFVLIEENSTWDSDALLSNFVKEAYGEDYQIIREQGLTIYLNKSNATWVNGGKVFKLTAPSGTLTNKQIKSIAVSIK